MLNPWALVTCRSNSCPRTTREKARPLHFHRDRAVRPLFDMAPPSGGPRCKGSGSSSETNFSGAPGQDGPHHRWPARLRTGNRACPIFQSTQSATAPTKFRARLWETAPTNELRRSRSEVDLYLTDKTRRLQRSSAIVCRGAGDSSAPLSGLHIPAGR